jgi:hypothetical protein
MKLKDWLNYTFPTHEVIIGAGNPDGSSSPQKHPIGIYSNRKASVVDQAIKEFDSSQLNSYLCYCNVREWCYLGSKRRRAVMQNVYDYSFATFEGLSAELPNSPRGKGPIGFPTYMHSTLRHKFSISPDGNGLDCHRHYESIMGKSIPIIQYPDEEYCKKRWGEVSKIDTKYNKLPVLWTHDYSELTEDYLNDTYAQMLETDYNFDKLKVSFWRKKSPKMIPNMEYWSERYKRHDIPPFTNKPWFIL